MVGGAAVEASSLRVSAVSKSFPLPDDPTARRLALDAVSYGWSAFFLGRIDAEEPPGARRCHVPER